MMKMSHESFKRNLLIQRHLEDEKNITLLQELALLLNLLVHFHARYNVFNEIMCHFEIINVPQVTN